MQKRTLKNGNELIAEFMNLNNWNDGRYGKLYSDPTSKHNKSSFELLYHESWGWLMPVVLKIGNHPDFNVSFSSVGDWAFYISRSGDFMDVDDIASRGNFTPEIDNIWLAVVDFIKWYNKQPKYKNEK